MSKRQQQIWDRFKKTIPQRLRELRAREQMTHAEFGAKFGVIGGTSIRWCSGTTLPDLPCLLEIQKSFNLPPSYFFEV